MTTDTLNELEHYKKWVNGLLAIIKTTEDEIEHLKTLNKDYVSRLEKIWYLSDLMESEDEVEQ